MSEEQQQMDNTPSAGTLLRQARETAGLSLEDVAEKLYLLRSVVDSLEKDCYERIRGETFVRGYLRNYARLLEISDVDVLRRHAEKRDQNDSEPPASRFGRRPESKWSKSAGAGRLGVVLALLTLGALFFLYNREPVVAGTKLSTHAAVMVETGRGLRVVPLVSDSPGAEVLAQDTQVR